MSKETALATQNPLEAPAAVGFRGLDLPEEIQPSQVVLKQPTTEGLEAVLPGRFVHRDTGSEWVGNKIVFIPLQIRMKRSKNPSDKFVRGEKAICRSNDGKFPILNNPNLVPQASSCDEKVCPHASWDNYDKVTKTGAPTCRKSYEILFIDEELNMPFRIELNGKSAKTAAKLKKDLSTSAVMYSRKHKRDYSIYDFAVTMDSVKNEGTPTYIARFPKIELMTPAQAAKFGPIYETLVESRAKAQAEAEAADYEDAEVIEEAGSGI